MADTTNINELISEAKCYDRCIPPGMQAAVQTYLLAVIAGGTTDPDALMQQAKCFASCIPKGMLPYVQAYLLDQIANA